MIAAARVTHGPRTVAFHPQRGQFRAASIQDHGTRMPKDARFEVVYQLPSMREVAWRFFATRAEADSFVQEVR